MIAMKKVENKKKINLFKKSLEKICNKLYTRCCKMKQRTGRT
jgi:hypothetical protein